MYYSSTIDKLHEMKLITMADAYTNQRNDPKAQGLTFDERFGLLIDIEYTAKKSEQVKRLTKRATFDQPEASIVDVDYNSGRKLDKDLIMKLAACSYIPESLNVFITGATGCGKTFLACALGIEACKQYYDVKYLRLPDLLVDLEIARANNSFPKKIAKFAKPKLLIIDEWLLLKPTETEQRDIFELLNRRYRKSATIFCSQYSKADWYEQLGGSASPLADAILDRIVHDGYDINITPIDPKKDISMREVYGLARKLKK